MRRKDREMDRDFALMVLDTCEYAVLATVGPDQTPSCIPLTIVRDGDFLYFHCAPQGQKIQYLRQNPRVCLTAVGHTCIQPDAFTTAYQSAVVWGTAEEVTTDQEKIQALRLLCQRHVPTNMAHFEKAISDSLFRTAVWKIQMETVTGKSKQYNVKFKK